jgi:hypothetical protein
MIGPALAAISLALVGQAAWSERIGRNTIVGTWSL